MHELDAIFRGAAMAIVVLFAATFWRARPNGAVAWVASLFAAGVTAFLVWTHPASVTWLLSEPPAPLWPRFAALALAVPALPTPFFFWLLTRLIFEDGFQLRTQQSLWFAIIEGIGLADAITWEVSAPWLKVVLGFGFRLPSLALVAHALWVIGRCRPGNLAEARARLWVVMLCGGIASALVLLAAIFYAPERQRAPAISLGEATAIMLLSVTAAIILTRVRSDLLPNDGRAARLRSDPVGAAGATREVTLVADAEILARVESLMAKDEVWREQGLTIGGLAKRLAIPEYRLRRLINQRLGFRNFSAFVNDYRLAAAAAWLADPAQARIPVLTIALDLGWGSIGPPFNRAFRVRFGMTPSDYRRERLAETVAIEQRRDGS